MSQNGPFPSGGNSDPQQPNQPPGNYGSPDAGAWQGTPAGWAGQQPPSQPSGPQPPAGWQPNPGWPQGQQPPAGWGQQQPGQYPAPGQYGPGPYGGEQQYGGDQYAAGGYGPPGQYGQQPYGPQQPWGTPPPAPAPPNRSNRLLFGLIGGILAVVLIGGVIWAVRNNNSSNNNPAGPQPTSSTGVQSGPAKGSDAVRAYLEALNAGDAAAAINLKGVAPEDSTFLTNAVLAKATAGKITNITVPEVADPNARDIPASYTLDGTPISTTFPVYPFNGRFWLLNIAAEVDISDVAESWAPVSLAGVTAKWKSTVSLFPGVYKVASTNKNLTYGSTTIVVRDLAEQTAEAGTVSLSAAGKKAVLAAAKEKYSWCLRQKSLAPSGCGFYVTAKRGQKVRTATIRWTTRKGGKVGSAKLKLISSGIVEGKMSTTTVHFYGLNAKRAGWYFYKDVKIRGFDAKLSGTRITVSFWR
ncbi:MAG: hypothetical protein QM582_08875 [Micropruina sp.]|uniref:hypothetical protein n=1 Tax=Micropruina sp. TaxID=2737536 RepID=UPI0039E2E6F6